MTEARRKGPPKSLQTLHHHGHRWLPWAFLLTGAALFVAIILVADDASKCLSTSARPHEWWLFIVGILAFGVGRTFSYWGEPKSYDPAKAKASAWVTHGALGTVYAVFALAWLFEAVGTAGGNLMGLFQADAISFYVRCAVYLDLTQFSHGAVSAIVIALVCFGTGHWLWAAHPTETSA